MHYAVFETKKGWMGVVASSQGLRFIVLPKPTREMALAQIQAAYPQASADDLYFGNLPQHFIDYWDGKSVVFSSPLDLSQATPFQRAVWITAQTIPYGQTRSYQWLANEVGKPHASRAVGQALAHNPLPIVVPCHRIVGQRGLGGFSDGLDMKQYLLDLEAGRL